MNDWMTGFAKLLQYTNPSLVDEDEEMQPGELVICVSLLCDILIILDTLSLINNIIIMIY